MQCARRCGLEVHLREDLIPSWKVLNLCSPAFSGPCRLEDLALVQCICLWKAHGTLQLEHKSPPKKYSEKIFLSSKGISFFNKPL